MGKRSFIASTVALILTLAVLPLLSNMAVVFANDELASEESHFQVIVPATIDPAVTLIPVADATIESAAPDAIFGHDETLSVYYGGQNEIARALIRFNLAAAVPPEAIIDSARLNLFLEYGEGPERVSLIASCLAEDWYESDVTWNNRPGAVEPVVSTVVDTAPGFKSLDVTEIVLAWHNVPHYGLELRGPEGETLYLLFFDSREGEIPAQAPQLVVNYHLPTPTPTPTPIPTPIPTPTPTPTPTSTPIPTPTPTPTPTSEGWCCYNNEVFPSSEHECSTIGGTFFSTEQQAQEYCTMGWCCHEGEVFPSSGHECSATGGTFFSTEQEAEEYCQQEFPPEPGGWCCYDGQVFPTDEPACSSWGGMFFSTQEEAGEYCQSVTPTPVCTYPDAAGDTFNTAATLTPFIETQEYICPSGDVDWWKFPVEAGHEISVYLYDLPTAPDADYDLFLFDPSGAQKASSEVFGAEKGEYIYHQAYMDGDWRVMVRGKGWGPWGAADWSKTTPYKLRVDLKFACFFPDEAGDTFADATPLLPSIPQAGISNKHTGYICPQGDIDFYKFEVSGGQTVTITADLTGLPADYDMILRQPDGSIADYSNNSGTADEHVTYVANNIPGSWRVSVFGPGGIPYHSDQYELEVSLTGNADLTVQGIEITQAIQDLDNNVTLVRDKLTVARVYVDIGPVAGPVSGVEVELRAWSIQFGWSVALSGTLTKGIASVQNLPLHDQRMSSTASVNFFLPKSWLEKGDLLLEARVNPNKTVPETDFTNNSLQHDVSLTGVAPINIGFVAVTASGVTPSLQNNAQFNSMINWLRDIFPAGRINIWFKKGGPLNADYDYTSTKGGGCGDGWGELLEDLNDIYDSWKDRPGNAFVYGVLSSQVPHYYSGCGRMSDHFSAGILSGNSGPTLAHELGHNFGCLHSPSDRDAAGNVINPDCQDAANEDNNYPQYTDPQGNPYHRSSIGEVGINVSTGQTFDPLTDYDLMSYCSPEWISPYIWERIVSKMPHNPGSQAMPANGADEPHLVASGRVSDDQIELPRPFWIDERPAGSYDEQGDGPYSMELQNAQGNVVFIRHFDPDADCSGPDHDCGYFRETLPFSQETMRIVFRHQGEIMRVVEVSPNAPTVTVLSPNGGEIWDGAGPYTITWHAEDADGDPLVARVLYSDDGGESWEPLAVNVLSEHYEIDASDLPGSDNALVKIKVSDGINTTSDVSNASFRVTDKAPLVFLLWPEEGERLLPNQPAVLAGLATDPEDGPLPDDALAWFSNVDGPLGVGGNLLVDALSCGAHEITLRATDSSGMVGMATVQVYRSLFEFTNLSVSPSLVGLGENVTITTEVINTSGIDENCMAKLLVDGTEEATQEITLSPGASGNATFTVSRDSAGTYAVEIEGLTSEFTVVAPFPWMLVGGIIGGVLGILAVTAVAVYFRVFRKK